MTEITYADATYTGAGEILRKLTPGCRVIVRREITTGADERKFVHLYVSRDGEEWLHLRRSAAELNDISDWRSTLR